jgi:hypothetical protein
MVMFKGDLKEYAEKLLDKEIKLDKPFNYYLTDVTSSCEVLPPDYQEYLDQKSEIENDPAYHEFLDTLDKVPF